MLKNLGVLLQYNPSRNIDGMMRGRKTPARRDRVLQDGDERRWVKCGPGHCVGWLLEIGHNARGNKRTESAEPISRGWTVRSGRKILREWAEEHRGARDSKEIVGFALKVEFVESMMLLA